MSRVTAAMLLAAAFVGVIAYAQTSTGIVTGTVTDQSGAVIANTNVSIVNKATGAARAVTANAEGIFTAPLLEAGDYEIRAERPGFRNVVREAQVQAGTTVTVNLEMTPGAASETVTVESAAAQINLESNTIQGVIPRATIQELPLNGRSFLQLATLEPGITTVASSPAQFNSVFTVSVLGGISGRTLVTIDGASIADSTEGGSSMNFSQEVVQEFQLQSLNFDLSTGFTSVGAINVVTRGGGNDFHGSGYFFFRDHNMAAYPGLARQTAFPNPFFARRNPGFSVGGPIKKDKLFFFFNYEYQNQVQAVIIQHDLPQFAPLDAAYSSPYHLKTLSARIDYHLSDKHTLFTRYSHDGNTTFGPAAGPIQPSGWVNNDNWVDQSIMGVTSILRPSVVNDFRFQYQYWRNNNTIANPSQCVAPCIGVGLPGILATVGSSFAAGNNVDAPQLRNTRRFQLIDSLVWQKGSHRLKFGADIEHFTAPNLWDFCDPFCTVLLAPGVVGPSFPVKSSTDVLNMPVYNIPAGIFSGIGVGQPGIPGAYHHDQENGNTKPRVYATDTWKLRPNLTVNLGLGWEYETGLFNSDLPKPAFLAPIYGANNLHATRIPKTEFEPAVGFAWSPGKSGRTVIRGGAGIYWETNYYFLKYREEAVDGPLGNGRVTLDATALTNTYSGVFQLVGGHFAPLPIGAPLPINTVSTLTLGQMLNIYNAQIGALQQKFAPTGLKSGAFPVSGLDIAKQAIETYPPDYRLGRSYQTSLGVQRDLGHDMILSVDWARRQASHFNLSIDLDANHTNDVSGLHPPTIPACTAAQRYVAGQECVQGPINQWTPEGRSIYEGLLVKLQKRFSHRYQFNVSYAFQNNNTDYTPVNSDNYMESYGPTLARHNLNIAGTASLRWGFQLSLNSQIISRTPVSAVTTGIDLSGSGVASSGPLPGLSYNCLGITCGKSDLAAAVNTFNSTYAGKTAPNGAVIPSYVLPSDFQTGDPIFSQDFRLTKTFTVKERYKFSVLGEVFNAFNIANLRGYNLSLDTVNPKAGAQTFAFGQPTQRTLQTFGSGGPRAIQVGARFTF